MEPVTRKIGTNKGRPRLWLEGKVLTAAGFNPGDRYDVLLYPAWPGATLLKKADGNRKVSGKGSKPIIDILGKTIEEIFPHAIPAVVTITSRKEGQLQVDIE